ncbi:MAG: vWA domain-containing protein, partial [Planctomycetia bacterium]
SADGATEATESTAETSLRRGLVYSKLLLNVFGPNALKPKMSAADYKQWCEDVARMERCFGCEPGDLRGQPGHGPGRSASGTGMGAGFSDEQLEAGLKAMEADIVQRMSLREVLADDTMAAQLAPSMDLTEQLLLEKGGLSGNALKNAKLLIQKFVDQLAEALKKKVEKAVKGRIDRSVPPKRVFRNLDIKRTVWKNLTNYSPAEGRLYVDRLFYKQTGTKTLPKTLIVVADQSGSMVDAMVQTAILASIFASLPKVDVHLIAFDTAVLDLTPWVHEPFETLMRTNLGGGNDGPKAMLLAQEKVKEPRNTTMVWISDFYEFGNDQPLFAMIKAVKESGVRFV